ncbi:lipopolysaccharide biosynthesis protein RfbH [Acidaminobacter sp.]|uniref:lipopolysaccharide biosynthesis protein RfbH n=1 Tax=Acidaminobacter sp. TaxID=1872102 RepID=UPI00137E49C8|nr:lipopolysaccharide biosynthesis protein RfbH [Acidaminobacter sp.]MDK9710956.1 lipopolysaccharide biosynthesis protein RfbH [Acidaminobacter sp.]MZQ98208.1 lipopolysaccharide biosynthesis protein RfbH [Acidaminobacter sp.]
MTREEARDRDEILQLVKTYYENHHQKAYQTGDRIVYAGRVYDEEELMMLVNSALDFWLTGGRYTDSFEQMFANYLGVRHCFLVNSGSSANLLAFMSLTSPLLGEKAIKHGDEIITVAAAFPTTIAPIIQYGAVPVFVDVTIPQYNIDVEQLNLALSNRTKAVMIAHTLGNPFNVEAVRAFCDAHQLWLIEDNCDALGTTIKVGNEDKLTGTFGDLATSSFYPPHHMTMGEGGAVYTNNDLLAKILMSMRDWGRDCQCKPGMDNLCGHRFDKQYGELPKGYDHKYVYTHFGYNLKATDMQGAIGCAQIKKLPDFVRRRRENWQYLKDALSIISDRVILPEAFEGSSPSWFGFMMTLRPEAGLNREVIIKNIEARGVQTRMLFSGNLIRHPCFDQLRQSRQGFRVVSELENTDFIMNNSLWVGVYPGLNQEMLEVMSHVILDSVRLESHK